MSEYEKSSPNPLTISWNIISNIAGVLGLVSMGDDLIAWKDFFPKLIEAYRGIIHWPFTFFPFYIPEWIKDYLFLGLLVSGSFVKGFKRLRLNLFLEPLGYLIIFPIWPILLIIAIEDITRKTSDPGLEEIKKQSSASLYWLASVIIVFFIAILFNAFFL